MSPVLEKSNSLDNGTVEKHVNNERAKIVPVEARVKELEAGPQSTSRLESLSAYFTIAAAAFGLISDGCWYSERRL